MSYCEQNIFICIETSNLFESNLIWKEYEENWLFAGLILSLFQTRLRLSSQPELFLGLLSAITTFVNSLCRSSAVDIRQAIP